LDALDEERALMLLARWSNQKTAELPPEAPAVAAECGYLPLALAMIGAMVRAGLHTGCTPWRDCARQTCKRSAASLPTTHTRISFVPST